MAWKWQEDDYTVIRSTCGGGGNACDGACGVLLYVKDGKLRKVEGDPNYPYNQGRLCIKGLSATQMVYHPDRLKHPMKRTGKRGEGKWLQISWEEAFDTITTRLKEIREKYGPESIVYHSGTGRGLSPWTSRAIYGLGSPNWATPGYICYFPRILAAATTFGVRFDPWVDYSHQFPDRYSNPQWRKPECIMVWGCNPPTTNFMWFGHWLVDLMKMGTKIIMVDPRLIWLSSKADVWLQVRPGTDDALALGMLNVIVSEGLYDKEFVEQWTNAPFLVRNDNGKTLKEADILKIRLPGSSKNFVVWDSVTNEPKGWDTSKMAYRSPDVKPALQGTFNLKLSDGNQVQCRTVWQALQDRLREYTPERVSDITWVPREKIVAAARLFANSKPSAIHWGVGAGDQTSNSFQSGRALCLLMALVGNFDVPGGWTSERKPWNVISHDMAWGFDLLSEEQRGKTLDVQHHPLLTTGVFSPANHNDVYKAILTGEPYQVKAFLSIGGGCVLVSNEDTKNVYEALMKVDFLVQADLLPSPMTELADIVLPVASWVERDNIRAWWLPLVSQNEALRTEGVKTDLEILAELSRRLDAQWPWKTTEELFDYCLEPVKMSYREFQNKGPLYPPYEYYKYKKGSERPDGNSGFGTVSGKVEIFSSFVENLPGIDPLPFHVEPAESPVTTPELLKEYPYVLTTGGRIPGFFHSEGRQIPWMRELHPDPLVELHPKTAKEIGINDGDWVYVETKRGKAKMKAKLFIGIDPRVVRAEHNWWYPERLGKDPYLYGALEPNVNRCTDPEHCDPSMGSSTLRGMLCNVYRAED